MSTCTSTITVDPLQHNNLDDEIYAFILQLEEISDHGLHGKGKFPAASPPDNVVAFDSFQAEVDGHLTFLRDLKLAHSIAHAIETDADAIAQLADSEEQAHDDRDYALQLSGVAGENQEPNPPSSSEHALYPQWLAAITAPTRAVYHAESSTNAGPSVTYADRQAKAIESLSQEFECCVCYEQFHTRSMVSLDCGDRYCIECLKRLFMRATRDETFFPPRCCRQKITIDLISRELSGAETNAFKKAEVEFTTGDRTYCSNVLCGAFIAPVDIMADKAFCTQCREETCTMCKSEFHQGTDCPADPSLQQTLSLAEHEGWQRCYACGQLVELEHGCHHMTCKCGAQFCYICGERWKTCRCDNWNEHRLFARARQVVRREAPVALPQAQLGRRVDQIRDRLRDNPECAHPTWQEEDALDGAFRCEMCAESFQHISQCTRCHVIICRECRRNQMR